MLLRLLNKGEGPHGCWRDNIVSFFFCISFTHAFEIRREKRGKREETRQPRREIAALQLDFFFFLRFTAYIIVRDDHFFKSEVFLPLDFHPPCSLVFVVFFSFLSFICFSWDARAREKRKETSKQNMMVALMNLLSYVLLLPWIFSMLIFFFFVLQGWFIRFFFSTSAFLFWIHFLFLMIP